MSENITNNPSVPTQVVAEVKFPQFINNLGIIPTSYKDSMSYYETLAWLCKYLQETVLPTVNQNGNAVQELQGLYVELNNYVTHYFDNLDVQEEINNKLDEMVTTGALEELIAQYFVQVDNKINQFEEELTSNVDSIFAQLQNEMTSLTSGSPAGVYATTDALATADPDHSKIYVVTATGKWYYYNTAGSTWAEGGTYQSTGIAEGSIGALETNTDISRNIQYSKTAFSQNYDKFVTTEFESGYITPSNGNLEDSIYTIRNSKFHTYASQEIKFISKNPILRCRYYCYATDGTYDSENSSNWLSIGDTFTLSASKKYKFVIGTNNSTAFNMDYLTQCGFVYSADYIENNMDNLKSLALDNSNNYNIDLKSIPFSANANKNVAESKKITNYELGTITFSNGNNLDGFNNCMRNISAIEIKNCVIINLNPTKYKFRLIYYNAKGGYNNATYVGSTGWYQQLVTRIQNENYNQRSKYSRIIIYAPNDLTINIEDALNSFIVINTEDKVNYKKPFIDVMAHQGGIGLDTSIPSNTLNAFNNCAKYDFTGFECDVRKTSDDVFIISHDLERTSTGGVTINVNEETYDTINSMQFYSDASIKIPTLEQALQSAKLNGMKIDIELKDEFSESEITSICNLVKNNSMENHVVFSSFITQNLLRVRNIFENVKVLIPMNSIIDPSDLEEDIEYANYRTLRSQAKTLLSMTTDTMSGHTSDVETYIKNGFGIRVCYYGTDITVLTNYIKYADTILLNTEDLYSILYYFR